MADDLGSSTKRATTLLRSKSPQASPIQPLWIAVACVFAIILAWAYWPTFGSVATAWLSNPDYTHGFFVIPISLWLLWLRREHAPVATMRIDWRGLSLLVLAGVIRFVAGRFYVLQLDAWSIPIWVAGVVWLLFGWQLLRWALPAIAFLWFATPLPGTIEILLSTPLQRNAASLSAWVLRLIGQPALVQGTTILLDDKPLDVERACSGLRMFYGIFALAVACVALSRPERWKAVLVLFAAAPVAIIANVFRIVITALLMKFASNETAQKFSHDFAGIVMIPLAVTLFLLFLVLLGKVVNRMRDPRGVAWLIRWCVGGVVLLGALLLWGRHQDKRALTTLLDTATRYETEKEWAKAVQNLSLYVRSVPDDYDTFTRLARLYHAHSGSYQEYLRAVDLLRTAWQNQPEHEDLAISSIQVAVQIQDFDDAIQTSTDLLAKAKKPSKIHSQATKLHAEALNAYLLSDKNRGDYNWNHVKKAFENAVALPDYEVAHAVILADVYRNPKVDIKSDEREKLASKMLNKVITERPTEPLAWLARFRYRLGSKKPEDKTSAEADLARAIELAGKQPQNPTSGTVLITAAAYKTERQESKQATSLLERAMEIAPTDSRPYLMLTDLKTAVRTKESIEEAVAILRKGIDRIGKREANQAVLLNLRYASLLADQGKLTEAESALAPIESMVPHLAGRGQTVLKLSAGLVRSQILLARDGPQPAMANLRDLLDDSDIQVVGQQMPDLLAKGYAFLGQLYSMLGISDLALDSFRQAARIQPTNTAWQFQAAALAHQTGDLDTADREYREFIQKGQATGDIQAAHVEVEIKRQLQLNAKDRNWKQVQDMVRAADKSGASPVTIRQLVAEIQSSSGEREKAESTIVKLTEESPKEPAPWRTLALMRLQRADVPGALQAAEKFAAVANQPLEGAALKAGILASAGRKDEAIKELTAAADKAQPKERAKAALALSQLLAQSGKPDEARGTLEKAHEKDPKNPQIVDALANTALLMQDWKALEKYEGWLRTIEGDGGTSWRAYRVQRMLASAQSFDDKDFQEAVAQTDDIIRKRPHWSKSHYLRGEIAYRMNQTDSATAAYERAWQYGGRGILLADRLIDLLTKQNRFDDGRRYVAQVRDYLTVSQGLFDRAIPYMAKGDDSEEMARMAQQWVKQKPNDSEARLRYGRVLLLLSNSPTVDKDKKEKYIDQAKNEFRRAIELTPNDVRPWAAIVMLYGESPTTRGEALKFLEDFSKQAKISELERAFVLAQLYELLGISSQAQFHYSQAAALVEANPKAAGGSRVLGRIARFYLPRVPALGERYAHQALAQDQANPDAKLVLLSVFASRTDARSAEEGLRILDDSKMKALIDPAIELRNRAAFLSRRGRPDDINAAIDVLRRANSQSRDDKLLLARLYEQSGQMPPALDLLQQLVRAPNANANELAEFLRFWQQHFVASTVGKAPVQFAGQAKDAYQRLGELPNQLPERLRWQLRELRVRKSAAPTAGDPCMPLVKDLLASPAAMKLNELEKKQLMQVVLIVLLQEQREECAMQFATEPQNGAAPDELAIWLCHSYVAVPLTKESAPVRKQAIDKLLAAQSKNANVIQATGDCLFMAAEYERAADAYQQVIQLKPEEHMSRNNLALALVEMHKVGEARQVLAVALKATPDDPDLLDTQAVIDIMDNHADQAIPVLEKLVAKIPENPVLRFHLAMAYNDAKNAKLARETLVAATALGVEQQVLSPRDKKTLADLKARYMAPEATTITDNPSANASQARN